MNISLIAAMTEKRVIGYQNKMPWHIKEELQYFKTMTMGKTILMGRKTFDAISRRLLPGRETIILTRDKSFIFAGAQIVHSIEEALQVVKKSKDKELMVVGGAGIYQQFLNLADKLYLSIVTGEYLGDTYFPEFDLRQWQLTSNIVHQNFIAQTWTRKSEKEGDKAYVISTSNTR